MNNNKLLVKYIVHIIPLVIPLYLKLLMSKLNYSTSRNRDIVIINISGELDIDTAHILNENAKKEIDGGVNKIVIDMKDVSHITSTGLGVLLNIKGLLQKYNGDVKIFSSDNYAINKIFKMQGLANLFELFNSMDTAIKSFDKL
jgi:anti-sigma B factor antagonist